MTSSIILAVIVVVSVSVTCLLANIEASTDLLFAKTDNEAAETINVTPMGKSGPIQSIKSIPLEVDSGLTMATKLVPALFQRKINEETILTALLMTNVIAVKNETAEDLNDVVNYDVINQKPAETADIHLIDETERIHSKSIDISNVIEQKTKIQDFSLLASLRKKRGTCEKCTVVIKQQNPQRGRRDGFRGGHRGGQRGGCRRQNCGGNAQQSQPPYQVVYQTIYQYPTSYYAPQQQQYYPQPQQQQYYSQPTQQPYYSQPTQQPYYPQPTQQPHYSQPEPQQQYPKPQQQCNTCGGGGNSNGGGTAYAVATAQASASSSSGSIGR